MTWHVWQITWCTLRAAGRLVLCVGFVMGALGATTVALGQVPDDSVRTDTLRQEPFPAPQPAPPDSVRAEDVGPSDASDPEKAIVTADSLSAIERRGERIQELFDNVFVRQDTTRLRSNFGLRYLNRDELLFTGDVVLYERGDTLRTDTLRYNKRTKVGRANGNVRLTDGEVVVRAPQATYYTEEKRSVFPDSVTLVDSTKVLRAQTGTYWSDARRAEFQGSVRLTDPESYLEADSLTYYRDEERSIATSRVFVRRVELADTVGGDTTSITYLFGDWLDNQEQRRYSRVEGSALLVRVRLDSTGAPEDSMAVRAHELEAQRTDARRRLIATDSVRVWQADLAAVADSAVYDRVVARDSSAEVELPRPSPENRRTPPDTARTYATRLDSLIAETRPPALESFPPSPSGRVQEPSADDPSATDRTRAPAGRDVRSSAARTETDTTDVPPGSEAIPDSVRRRQNESPESASEGWGSPVPESEERLPIEETRLFQSPITWFERAQVWGDSIRVRAHERSLDTVYVRGAAFAAQMDTTLDRIQQLKGQDITAYFQEDTLRRLHARPNARAIRFMASEDERTLRGAAKSSGDRIVIRFRDGTVRRVRVIGGVQSSYYRKPEHIPDPFQLDGFQWTPERRPTKRQLLRSPQVRRKLGLEEQLRPPLATQDNEVDTVESGGVPNPYLEGFADPDVSTDPGLGNRAPSYRPRPPDSLFISLDSLWMPPSYRTDDAAADTTDTINPEY